MKHDVVEAVSQLLREKGIDRETFEEIIESVFLSMVKRKYNRSDNFAVTFNIDKGDIEIQYTREVVPDGEVTDPIIEISLSDAYEYDPYVEIGEEIIDVIDYEEEFGRRIVHSARQHLVQRIREIEKENTIQEYSQRIGEIVIGDIHQITYDAIRINIDKTEVIMPRSEQVPREKYRRGDTIKAIILEIRESKRDRDKEIVVSRRDESFVRRLFELEVPEIYDGIVEIKTIAREAGERTKIFVISNDRRIDPVGACVGPKGVRIRAIINELSRDSRGGRDDRNNRDNSEKIDVIHWTDDPELMIRRAFAPIIPLDLVFLEGGNKVLAVIQDDKMAQAIGKKGQNIRLASRLTGYEIEPIKASGFYQEEIELNNVEGISPQQLEILTEAGYRTAEDVWTEDLDELMNATGFNAETTEEILSRLNGYFDEEND
ncbi:MAG: transcription termination factor NusA [Candidatus Electryoneaceae bacterium]|nr:transcription termination factor NusA [Candidatus Electryoneaceae bacterium]